MAKKKNKEPEDLEFASVQPSNFLEADLISACKKIVLGYYLNYEDSEISETNLISDVSSFLNIDYSQAESLTKIVRNSINNIIRFNRYSALKKAVLEREQLYLSAKEQNQIKVAADIIKDRDRLLGLYTQPIEEANADLSNLEIDELMAIKDSLIPYELYKKKDNTKRTCRGRN